MRLWTVLLLAAPAWGGWAVQGMSVTGDRYCPSVPLGSAAAGRSLQQLQRLGANSAALIVTYYQQNISSPTLGPVFSNASDAECHYYRWITTTPEELRTAIKQSHELGMRVLLKPHVDLIDNHMPCGKYWRGDIGKDFDADQWNAWFESYEAIFLPLATMAEEEGVEALSMNCELINANKQSESWKRLVAKTRAIFSGKLTVAANWYPGPTGVDWWSVLDWIGIDAYYPLKSSTMDGLRHEWDVILDALDLVHKVENKPVLFTEVGFPSGSGLRDDHPTPADYALQATQYEALMLATQSRSWFLGFHWWNWDTDPGYAQGDSCFTPQWKPSSAVLARYYNGTLPTPDKSDPATCIGFGKCTS